MPFRRSKNYSETQTLHDLEAGTLRADPSSAAIKLMNRVQKRKGQTRVVFGTLGACMELHIQPKGQLQGAALVRDPFIEPNPFRST